MLPRALHVKLHNIRYKTSIAVKAVSLQPHLLYNIEIEKATTETGKNNKNAKRMKKKQWNIDNITKLCKITY